MQRVSQCRVGSAEFLNVELTVRKTTVHHGVLACVCMIFNFWHAKMQNFTPPMMEFFKYMGGGIIIKGNFSACLPRFKNINIMLGYVTGTQIILFRNHDIF